MSPTPESANPAGLPAAATEETVDGVPVLAEVRAIEPARPRRYLPAVQAAAVAATGFAAGVAAVVAIQRQVARRPRVTRRRSRRAGGETMSIVGTRSFLLDVHLLARE